MSHLHRMDLSELGLVRPTQIEATVLVMNRAAPEHRG